jgi:2-polyprenyl-3-methyl-5-hydroxy-6-metoxy-1,4-benzoquinol methylase
MTLFRTLAAHALRRGRELLLDNALVLTRAQVRCPVCGHPLASTLRYGRFAAATGPARSRAEVGKGHEKYRCLACGHVYTTWFPALSEFSAIYSQMYEGRQQLEPSPRSRHQETLVRRLIARCGEGGRYLDFGCGGNFTIAYALQGQGLRVHACDIHADAPYDQDVFFRFDPDRRDDACFDGISSLDAIEHVQDIRATWTYFNRALRPGGFMVHSFPSAFRYGTRHYFFQIPFHSCLFSRTSLAAWSRQMGFEYLGPEPLTGSDVPECYWFQKVGPPS